MKFLHYMLFFLLLLPAYSAQAKNCEMNISANDMIKFDKSVLQVAQDCDEVTLTLTHTGMLPVTQMGHNWVLSETSVWKDVVDSGLAAGKQNDYLQPDDARVIAQTGLIGGGETASTTIDISSLDRELDYTFFCTFPGHAPLMNGQFILMQKS